MDHWFDRLTKRLAQGTLTRREMLGSAITASLAAMGAPLLRRSDAFAQMVLANIEGQTQEGCQVRGERGVAIMSLLTTTTFKGRSLSLQQTTRITPRSGRKGTATVSRIFKVGGSTLLQSETTHTAGSTRLSINYGAAFQGIRRASVSTTDGKIAQGEIDNRRILPFRIGADPSSVKFADGQPAPNVKVDSDLAAAVNGLLQKASQTAGNCSARRAHAPARDPASLYALASYPATHYATESYPVTALSQGGQAPHDSSDDILLSWNCIKCRLACGKDAIGCLGLCYWALAGYALCALGCGIAEGKCFLDCSDAGEGCCPVNCSNSDDLGHACCAEGETCYDPSLGICCSSGFSPCTHKRCCPKGDTCISNTGGCCPKGQTVCNDVCCKAGEGCNGGVTGGKVCCPPEQLVCNGVCCKRDEICVNNKCCPKVSACGNVCCDNLSKCVDPSKGQCCGLANEFCFGVCCKQGEQCLNNKCCAKPCGGVCCGSTQVCQKTAITAKCVSKACPQGQVTCLTQVDKPSPFGQPKVSATPQPMCCPPKVQCCAGKCCKPGEICCSKGGLPFGCYDVVLCTA